MRPALRPILAWAQQRRLVLAGCLVVLIGLWVVIPRLAAILFYRSSPEMRVAHQTWRVSSHRDVACGACHDRPGVGAMLSAAWGGRRRGTAGMETAPSERCLACHKPQEMPAEITYQLMLITHREHLDRGAECSDCHANVVHATDGPFANTPTMEACLVCHDGEQAADRCCLCHINLGDGHPPRYVANYLDPHRAYVPPPKDDACRRCHGDYVHDWTESHEVAALKEPETCRACHQDESCRSCHTEGRPQDHTAQFRTAHGEQTLRAAAECQICHKTGFCLSCHKQDPPETHTAVTFKRAHSGIAWANEDLCRTCHLPEYCDACHRGMKPSDHNKRWLHTHGQAASRSESRCRTCHDPQTCDSCHGRVKPRDHDRTWPDSHGRVALKSRPRCLECHGTTYCDTCHRVPMPHPDDISVKHGPLALGRSGRYCSLCHPSQECQACHETTQPVSHRAPDWLKQHAGSEEGDPLCALCHGSAGCLECHGLPMPHPDDWLLETHGVGAEKSPDACTRCHKTDYCLTCHESAPPKSHEAKEYAKTHGAEQEDEPLCALCHSRDEKARRDACLNCHRGIVMPHPDGYALQHKEQGSYKSDGPCLACHELEYCKLCHDDVP